MTILFHELFDDAPVLAILRGFGTLRTLEIAHRAWDTGVRAVEVPLQNAEDVDTLAALAATAGSDRVIGAGTIVNIGGVAQATSAGARFTVSPGWDPEIARASLDSGMAHLPGVATGTELQAARHFGLRWVKAFPAASLGPDWFRAMRAPFPDVSIVATGGIDADNAAAFLQAGAAAVSLGSALADPAQLARVNDILKARPHAN